MNNKGFSMVEIVISLGLGGLILAAVGNPVFQLVGLTHKTRNKIQTSMIETTLLHNMLNEDKLIQTIKVDKDPELTKCFGGVGNSCLSYSEKGLQTINFADLKQSPYEGLFSACDYLSQECPIEKSMQFQISCSSNTHCSGIEIQMGVKLHKMTNNTSQGTMAFRKASKFISGNKIFKQPKANMESCNGGVITSVNMRTGNVVCKTEVEPIECSGKSVVGLGDSKCGKSPTLSGGDFCAISFNPEDFNASTGSFGGVHLNYVASGVNTKRLSYTCKTKIDTATRVVAQAETKIKEVKTFDREKYLGGRYMRSFMEFLKRTLSWVWSQDDDRQKYAFDTIVERQVEQAENKFNERQDRNSASDPNLTPQPLVTQTTSLEGYRSENLARLVTFQSAGNNKGAIGLLGNNYNGGTIEIACNGVGIDSDNKIVSECDASFRMELKEGHYKTRRIGSSSLEPGPPWVGKVIDKVEGGAGVTTNGAAKISIVGNGSGFSTQMK